MTPPPEAGQAQETRSDSSFNLEAIIAIGLFGWLALSVTLMGFGIW